MVKSFACRIIVRCTRLFDMPSVKVSLTLINKSFCLGRASEGTSLCTVGHECILNCNLNPSFFPRYFSTVYVFICDRCVDVIYSWHNAQASAVWPGSAGPRAWKCACIVLSCFPVFSSHPPAEQRSRDGPEKFRCLYCCISNSRVPGVFEKLGTGVREGYSNTSLLAAEKKQVLKRFIFLPKRSEDTRTLEL